MGSVDWAALSALAMVVLGAVGYLSRQISRLEERFTLKIDRLEDHLGGRIDRLEEQYIRHLEAHATGR
jgi:hypothetical protein